MHRSQRSEKKTQKHILVLHIASVYGGAERTTLNIISRINKNAIQKITLMCPKSMLPFWGGYCDEWIDTDKLDLSGWYETPYKTFQDAVKVGRKLRSVGADLGVGMMHYSSSLLSIGSRIFSPRTKVISSFRGPVFQHLDNFEENKWRRFWIKKMVCLTSRLSHCTITPSTGTTSEIINKCNVLPNLTKTIPNGIDLDRIYHSPFCPPLPEKIRDKPFAIIAARLSREKCIDKAIYALSIIKDATDINLLILGEGDERKKLEYIRNKLHLHDRVFFLGHVEDPIPYIKQAKIYIHTCRYEGFGYSILEALACGTPVIAMDCPYGPKEILGNTGGGVLVSMFDTSELAGAILEISTNKLLAKKLSQRGLGVADALSLDKATKMYHDLFNALI